MTRFDYGMLGMERRGLDWVSGLGLCVAWKVGFLVQYKSFVLARLVSFCDHVHLSPGCQLVSLFNEQ
jgi:hypothetical protein